MLRLRPSFVRSQPSHLSVPIRGPPQSGVQRDLRLPPRVTGQRLAAAGPGGRPVFVALIGRQQGGRSEEHTSELQSQSKLVCRLLLVKKNTRALFPVTLYLS